MCVGMIMNFLGKNGYYGSVWRVKMLISTQSHQTQENEELLCLGSNNTNKQKSVTTTTVNNQSKFYFSCHDI